MKHKFKIWKSNNKYFLGQLKNTYRSTISFYNFLNKKIKLREKNIIDLACGNGGNLFYLKKNYFPKYLLGVDFNKSLIKFANNLKKKKKLENISFKVGNILKIKNTYKNKFEVATCLQTIPYVRDYQTPIKQIAKLNPKYICISGLFWEGLIDFKIRVHNLEDSSYLRKVKYFENYNIYSLKNYISMMKKLGYKKNYIKKFNVDKKINPKRNKKKFMGTYTSLIDKKNVQFSGPLLMNWFFIISKK